MNAPEARAWGPQPADAASAVLGYEITDEDIASFEVMAEGARQLLHEINDSLAAAQAAQAGTGTGNIDTAEQAAIERFKAVKDNTFLDWYDAARWLCHQGRFLEASSLAMILMLRDPTNGPVAFLLASCLQRLLKHQEAAQMYAMSLMDTESAEPVALYRLGECLLALGREREAESMFEAAQDVAGQGDTPASLAVKEMADQAIAAVRGIPVRSN